MNLELYRKGVELSRQLHKKFGKSYYFATYFFPPKLRTQTFVLYGFVRVPDEIVDNPVSSEPEDIKNALVHWWQTWKDAWFSGQAADALTYAQITVFKNAGVPFKYLESFMDSMFMDVTVTRYKTYDDLRQYMYGSASCVGLIMAYLIGFKNQQTLEYAQLLGEAFQVTNFLRDIGEDFLQRNRIYIPQADLALYGLTETDIANGQVTDQWRNFMRGYIDKNRQQYSQAALGIDGLAKEGRFAVLVALVLYREILRKIELNDYDVFTRRARTSFLEKIWLLGKAWRYRKGNYEHV